MVCAELIGVLLICSQTTIITIGNERDIQPPHPIPGFQMYQPVRNFIRSGGLYYVAGGFQSRGNPHRPNERAAVRSILSPLSLGVAVEANPLPGYQKGLS